MTEHDDLKQGMADLRADVREVISQLHELRTARAVAEERQIETSKKIDMLTMTVSNNYTSAIEFGQFKVGISEKVAKLENWLTWILRLTVGAVVLAVIAAARLKGGI